MHKLPEEERKRRRSECHLRWQKEHPEIARKNTNIWIERHPDQWRENCSKSGARYRAKKRQDPEWVKGRAEYMRNWRATHKESIREQNKKRYLEKKLEAQNA